MIVISTPSVFDTIRGKSGAEEPNWLMREIDRFLGVASAGTSPRPVDVVVGPGGEEGRFPGRLAERTHWDWVDLRAFDQWRAWGFSEDLDAGLTKLIASLYDVPDTALPALRREERRRRNRLLLRITSLTVVVASVITLLSIYAWQQRDEAIRQRDVADKQRLEAEQQRNEVLRTQSRILANQAKQQTLQGDPVTGALLALQGLPSARSGHQRPLVMAAVSELQGALWFQREAAVLGGASMEANSAEWGTDGRTLLVFDIDGNLLDKAIFNYNTKRWSTKLQSLAPKQPTSNLPPFYETSQLLARTNSNRKETLIPTRDGARLVDTATGNQLVTLPAGVPNIRSIQLSHDGNYFLIVYGDGRLSIRSTERAGEISSPVAPKEEINHALFSQDDKVIFAAFRSGKSSIF